MSEPLTDRQRARLQERLLDLRDELRAQLRDEGGLTSTVELDQGAVGRVSRVDALQQQQMAQATLQRHRVRLKRVETALQRLREAPEDFGVCPACGEEIGLARLQAHPESAICVTCASTRGE